VIPKDMRQELGIEEGSGFWVFSITNEGLLLKLVEKPNLENDSAINELTKKSHKIDLDKKNLEKTKNKYKKEGRLEEI